ncbi:MAG: hypothetical protein DWQ58_20125 [Microcystis aeruginosa TA09]|nr:MAG: hypothetical protein DWQ58_20125 [Microcystis aeruginosa TA09]
MVFSSFTESNGYKVPPQDEIEKPVRLLPIIGITHNGGFLSLTLPADFQHDGIHFLTPDEFSQQLAYIKPPEGKVIESYLCPQSSSAGNFVHPRGYPDQKRQT